MSQELGKHVAACGDRGRHTLLHSHSLRRVFEVALYATWGVTSRSHPSVKKFLNRWHHGVNDSVVRYLKSCLVTLRLNTLRGIETPRSVRGVILPRCYLGAKSVTALLQYTKIIRALPLPKVGKEEALKGQMERMTSSFTLSPDKEVLSIIRKIPVPHGGPCLPSDFLSSSSCLESTREEGGRSALLSKAAASVSKLKWKERTPLIKKVLPAAWSLDRTFTPQSALMRVEQLPGALADLYKNRLSAYTLDAEPVALKEHGLKWRIVTRHSAGLIAEAQPTRRMLFSILSNSEHIVTSQSLCDPEMGTIEFSSPAEKAIVFSADLSTATDLLSHEIIDNVCCHFGVNKYHVRPETISGLPATRGTCMGLPGSWPVLSLVHYAVCAAVDSKHNFRIKGDDLIALWSQHQIDKYCRLLKTTGMILNHSKTVKSHCYGTFCEVSYRREHNRLVRLSDFSLRSLVKGIPVSSENWLVYHKYGAPLSKLNKLFRKCHRKHILLAREHKVPLYLPEKVGGLGFPPPNLDRKMSTHESCAVNAVNNGIHAPWSIGIGGKNQYQMYRSYIKQNMRFVHGTDDGTTDRIVRSANMVLSRACLVDAMHSLSTISSPSISKRVKLLSKLFRNNVRCGTPYPTTYRTAHKVCKTLRLTHKSVSAFKDTFLNAHADSGFQHVGPMGPSPIGEVNTRTYTWS
ncbi:RNA-dependent RNA polymerase [Erysiphe necator associated narnavirus 9]|nr:RNA-dependent RNA polymerase [Erysiphe necator associated narnavirus 9]